MGSLEHDALLIPVRRLVLQSGGRLCTAIGIDSGVLLDMAVHRLVGLSRCWHRIRDSVPDGRRILCSLLFCLGLSGHLGIVSGTLFVAEEVKVLFRQV